MKSQRFIVYTCRKMDVDPGIIWLAIHTILSLKFVRNTLAEAVISIAVISKQISFHLLSLIETLTIYHAKGTKLC